MLRDIIRPFAIEFARLYFLIFKPKKINIPIKKVLLFVYPGIGDSIMSTAVIRELAKKYGNVGVSCYSQTELIFKDNPNINKIWVGKNLKNLIGIRKEKYDMAICLNQFTEPIYAYFAGIPIRHGLDMNAFAVTHKYDWPEKEHTIDTISRMSDINSVEHKAELFIKKSEVNTGVVIVPDAGMTELAKQKIWPPEYFAKLANMIGKEVTLLGINLEIIRKVQALLKVSHKRGGDNLEEFIDIISGAELVICNDSAAMHVAAAYDVPCVAIFGPTDKEVLVHGKSVLPLGTDCPYELWPCFHDKPTILMSCDRKCLTKLTPEKVYEKMEGML